MKCISVCAVTVLALASVASVQAAEAAKANIMRVYSDSVAPADQVAYEAGVKAYNKCLAEHGSKVGWTAWSHETGDVYQYAFVSAPLAWGTFDEMHAQDQPCSAVWQSAANPHLKSESSFFLELKPDMSYTSKSDTGASNRLMQVTLLKLKQGHQSYVDFMAVVKKIGAAATKSNWPVSYAFVEVMDGDRDAPDFIVTGTARNWVDFGKNADMSMWKMVEGEYGKAEADTMRNSLSDSIAESWSHINSRNKDLTYAPEGK